jgi:hypothetical protein
MPVSSRLGLVPAQVVEVLALPLPEAERTGEVGYASGYQVSPQLVLTARHAVEDAGRLRVRFGAAPDPMCTVDATLEWHGVAADLALLRLQSPGCQPAETVVVPTLGVLHGGLARRHAFTAVGFPAHKQRPRPGGGSLRDTDQVDGDIPTLANRKSRLLDLERAGRPLTLGKEWKGMSGAAVSARGLLVGVAIQAEQDGPLVAEPLAAVTEEFGSSLPERLEPADSIEAFRRLLDADGLPVRLIPVRREPAYAHTIVAIAARSSKVDDRNRELAQLAAFAHSDQGYQWWQAGPWAGKTTLAATFAAHPPGDVDVVAFFVSRTQGQQTDAYLTDTCDQLAALVDEPRPLGGLAVFTDLWVRCAEQARQMGRHLALVVDGLDENDTPPPIAALLPATRVPAAHVLVFSRHNPDIPEEVDPGHPMRDQRRCPRKRLTPSPKAKDLEQRASQDLSGYLTDPDKTPRRVLGLLAAAGPLTINEMATLLRRQDLDIEDLDVKRVVDRAAARVLKRQDRRPIDRSARYAFAHDALREAAATTLGDTVVRTHRDAVHRWAEQYAEAGWPDETEGVDPTPGYLLNGYPSLLARTGDAPRLAQLPSWARIRYLRRRTGDNGAAQRELGLALDQLATAADPDLGLVCVLALRRDRLLQLTEHSGKGAVEWAELGYWTRAEHLAQRLQPDARIGTLVDLSGVAARNGEHARAAMLLDAAETLFGELPRYRLGDMLSAAAEAAARLAQWDRAQSLAGRIDDPGERSRVLAEVAHAAVRSGERVHATALLDAAEGLFGELPQHLRAQVLADAAEAAARLGQWDRAEALASQLDDLGELAQALAEMAEAAARSGDPVRAEALLDRAEALTGQADSPYTRAWMLAVVARGAARVGQWDRAEALAGQLDNSSEHAHLLADIAEVAVEVGDVARIRAAAEAASQQAPRLLVNRRVRGEVLAKVVHAMVSVDERQARRELVRAFASSSAPELYGQALALDPYLVSAIVEELAS